MRAVQRLFAISDIHIDYKENREILWAWPEDEYQNDTLIIAGDATDDLALLERFLTTMAGKFRRLVFVPGNHELWVKRSTFSDSLDKFAAILALCQKLGVAVEPVRVGEQNSLWVVPLFSWYHTNAHPEDSLYLQKKSAEDRTFDMWSDFFVTEWPAHVKTNICDHFLAMNDPHLEKAFSGPVVSVSHFLPRQELMLSTAAEREASDLTYKDMHPEFNFSHVAGSKGIERQLRALGSQLHVYGHQHRNRCRRIDGVTYVSHCMGYPKERRLGLVADACVEPLQLWNEQQGFLV